MIYINIKFISIYLLVLIPFLGYAQLQEVRKEIRKIDLNQIATDSTQGWERHTTLNIAISQYAFKNWQNGDNNSIEFTGNLNHSFDYANERILWDNYLLIDFGLTKSQNLDYRKTDDRIEFNAIVGAKLPNNWSLSYFINLNSQLANSYNYEKDNFLTHRENGILAPLYISTGPGILWSKKSSKVSINIAPFTCKIIYINGNIYRYSQDLGAFESNLDTEILGIEPGKRTNYKLGLYSAFLYNFSLMENVNVENALSLYSNYLNQPFNLDIDYSMRIYFKINELLTTQLIMKMRNDDDAYPGWQARESLGVGFKFRL